MGVYSTSISTSAWQWRRAQHKQHKQKRKHKQNKCFCASCACAYACVNWEFAAVSTRISRRAKVRHLVLPYQEGMETKKSNYQICACLSTCLHLRASSLPPCLCQCLFLCRIKSLNFDDQPQCVFATQVSICFLRTYFFELRKFRMRTNMPGQLNLLEIFRGDISLQKILRD